MLRVLFFGTPGFAVPTLEAIIASPHRVVGVVTQPDRPSGRGQRVAPPPVKALALAHGIPVTQPERLKDEAWLEPLRAVAPDIGVVAAYGRILPDALLGLPRLGMVNVHASLLPAWRGASPVQHAVMMGDRETGVTIMRVVRELDAGPAIARATRRIGADETSEEVEDDLARLGARLLVETLDPLERGAAVETPQDHALATFAPRLRKEDGRIDWALPARALHDRVRGLRPWPLASAVLQGHRVVLRRTRPGGPLATPAPAGTIAIAHGDDLVVAAGDGAGLHILELQPEGRRAMQARDFLAGHRLAAGERFDSGPAA